MLPSSMVVVDLELSTRIDSKDRKPATPLAAAADGDVEALAKPAAAEEGDVEVLARLAARVGADRRWLLPARIVRRSLRRVFDGLARTGNIGGGAYQRSFVACYISKSSALCVRCYRRSFVPSYVAKASALGGRLWGAMGVVFNPLPAGSQLLPVTDPSLVSERLCFTPNTDRLRLLVLTVFGAGAVLFILLERSLVAFSKASDFYNNVEWLRMDMTQKRRQLPPPVGKQHLPSPVGHQQQQLPSAATEQQKLPPPSTEQEQLPPASVIRAGPLLVCSNKTQDNREDR